MIKIRSSEITSEHIYLSRRKFMTGMGTIAAGTVLASCANLPARQERAAASQAEVSDKPEGCQTYSDDREPRASTDTDELGDPLNDYEAITHYNNFYEFTTNKEGVASLSEDFCISPWQVEVGGLVNNPGLYDIDDLRQNFDQEERIYRLRCVEAWSMVIPWMGFPLHKLLQEVDPKSEAKYVRFETLLDPAQMPGQKVPFYTWPYVEGLRLDEARHDLTILATGMYGKNLVPANGAPIRLVVPWKYGYKSIKSIVKIELTDEMPASLWMRAAPSEYGFYSNVDPGVPHPRWSQATERRIGEFGRRDTLLYNGYAEEVASLYGKDFQEVLYQG